MALGAGTKQALTNAAVTNASRSKAVEAVLHEVRALIEHWGGDTCVTGLRPATLQALIGAGIPDRALARAIAQELATLRKVKRHAADTLFAPAVSDDWTDPNPKQAAAALDELAARKTEHHIPLISGGAFDTTGFT